MLIFWDDGIGGGLAMVKMLSWFQSWMVRKSFGRWQWWCLYSEIVVYWWWTIIEMLCCLISNLGWWPSTRSPLNVQLILAGGSEVTLREKLWSIIFPFFDEEDDGEWHSLSASDVDGEWWWWWWRWWWSPAVEGDVPLLVDGEEHRGGRKGRQARELAFAYLGFSPRS